MYDPMESSYDPETDGLKSQLPTQTAGGNTIPDTSLLTALSPIGGDAENSSKSSSCFTSLLRPGSMGTVFGKIIFILTK